MSFSGWGRHALSIRFFRSFLALIICLDSLVPFFFVLLAFTFLAVNDISTVCGLAAHLVGIVVITLCLISLLSITELWLVSVLELLYSEVYLTFVDGQLRQEWLLLFIFLCWASSLSCSSWTWTTTKCSRCMKVWAFWMMSSIQCGINNTQAQRYISSWAILLQILFNLMLESDTTITNQNVVNLLEIEINVIMMMSVLSSVMLLLFLPF